MEAEVKEIGLVASEIIHVCGRKGATVMPPFGRVVCNAIDEKRISNIKRHSKTPQTRPHCMLGRGYPPIGWKKILRGVTDAVSKSDNGNCWPTTGLFAIELALVENHPKELHLWGFDFYTKNYLIKKNRPYQTQKNPKVKMMKVHLERLVAEFHKTQFYCYSDIVIHEENWINA